MQHQHHGQVKFNEAASTTHSSAGIFKEDLEGMWYSRNDYQIMQAYNLPGERNCSFRKGNDKFKLSKRQANHVQSIVSLQQEHRDAEIADNNGLKTLSLALSKESCKEAQEKAANLAIDTFNINKKCPFMKAKSAKEFAKKTRVIVSGRHFHSTPAFSKPSKTAKSTARVMQTNDPADWPVHTKNYTYPTKALAKTACQENLFLGKGGLGLAVHVAHYEVGF